MIAEPRPRRPDVERAFAHIAQLGAKADFSGATDPLEQWVIALRRIVKYYGEVGEKPSFAEIEFSPVSANGVPSEWVTAAGGSHRDRIVYIHGGGWAGGAPEDVRAFTATLARLSGASVLAVDYRLAPEHRFPSGLDDCSKALAWANENGPKRGSSNGGGGDPARSLALVGDSSGGNQAVAACSQAIKNGARVPDRLVVIAPPLDNFPHPERIGLDDPVCPPESLAAGVANYLGPDGAPSDPRVSPFYESDDVLAKFPPTLIQASNIETLLYDSRKFARRLEEANTRVSLSVWPGLPHVWHHFTGIVPEAVQALQEIADFVKPQRDR
jgi:epsilon-lactone hydrolase